MRILGRKSEMINVGGEKVYPAEVESVIQEMANVAQVTVYGEPNPILGSIVCAQVKLQGHEDPKEFARRLKRYCAERLRATRSPSRWASATTSRRASGSRRSATRRAERLHRETDP